MIKSVKFDKPQYKPGETVNMEIILNKVVEGATLAVNISDLGKVIDKGVIEIIDAGVLEYTYIIPENIGFAGFGVDVEYIFNGTVTEMFSAAFDIVTKWSQAPRYGFLADFHPGKDNEKIEKRIEKMKDYHINTVQFYDWMYRHHELMPPEVEFKDIFDRPLSMDIVKKQVNECKRYGMRTMAYGAMYGAESDFVEKHPDWIAETRDGITKNQLVGIQIMNIAKECPWLDHIIGEYDTAMKEVGFDGIHIDQYGFPKTYYSIVGGKRELKDMGAEYGNFIEAAREKLGDADLIFNAVNNWPTEIVAKKPQDAIYIEVWGPNDTFFHLRNLILRAKELGEYQKQVILAAYIGPMNKKKNIPLEAGERAARMVSAAIAANGGFHLVLGEGASMLTDAYYPEFREMSGGFASVMGNYYDFMARYSKYLYSLELRDRSAILASGVNDEVHLTAGGVKTAFGPNGYKNSIWTIVKECKEFKTLNLVNMMGIDTINWDEPQYTEPKVIKDIEVKWLIDEEIKEIYWMTPDGGDIRPKAVEFDRVPHTRGEMIRFIIPKLDYWGMAVLVTE